MQKGKVKAGETDLISWTAIQRLGSPAGGGGGGLTGLTRGQIDLGPRLLIQRPRTRASSRWRH
jgi:hypothetical protein